MGHKMKRRLSKRDLKKKYQEYVEEKTAEIKRGVKGEVLEPKEWYTKVFGRDKKNPPVREKDVKKALSELDPKKRKKSFTEKLKNTGNWLKNTGKDLAQDFWKKTKYRYKSMKNSPKHIGKLLRGETLSAEERLELTTAAITTASLAMTAVGFGILGSTDFGSKGILSVAKKAMKKLTPSQASFKLASERGEDAEMLLLIQAVLEALGEHLEKMGDKEIEEAIEQARAKMLGKPKSSKSTPKRRLVVKSKSDPASKPKVKPTPETEHKPSAQKVACLWEAKKYSRKNGWG